MAKKANKVEKKAAKKPNDCEAYGIAHDPDEDECQACEDAEDCKEKTAKSSDRKDVGIPTKSSKKKAAEPEDDDDDDDAADASDDSLEDRVAALETRVAELTEALEKGGGKGGKRHTSKDEKDELKAKLMEGVPYDKKSLADLQGKQVKMLASAMGINSFGKGRDEVVGEILKSKANKPAEKKSKK